MKIKIIKRSKQPLPAYTTGRSAGTDLRASIARGITLEPHKRIPIPTALLIELPEGYETQIRPRNGAEGFDHTEKK